MANLFTSDLVVPESDPVEFLIDRVDIFENKVSLVVEKYTAGDEFVANLVPPTTYVENCIEDKTRIRVFLAAGQVAAGEKICVKLNS